MGVSYIDEWTGAVLTSPIAWSEFSRSTLDYGRRKIALKRFKKLGPAPFAAPLMGPAGMTVLVHKSTKKRGYWQATFFDHDGEPFGDSENASYDRLLDHIDGDSVDWRRAKRR